MSRYDYDLIIIGSGAGGSVGAHEAASRGKKVALFEKGDIGGECPNWACVPTKALLHAAHVYETIQGASQFGVYVDKIRVDYHKVHSWKNFVVSRTGASHGIDSFKSEHINVIREKAEFSSPHSVIADGKEYSAKKFLIASGSKVFIPPISGLKDAGYITFREAVDFKKVPKSIFVLGGGPVGCELAYVFATFGSKVTLVNRSDTLLGREDRDVSDLVIALFENKGIRVLLNTTIEKVEKKKEGKLIHFKKGNTVHTSISEEILVATGKTPDLGFAPEKAGIKVVDHRLKINSYLQTNVRHIFAAGDLVGPYLFTHTGYYQSYIAVHNAFSRTKIRQDLSVVPRCVYIEPEVASVGYSEEDAIGKLGRIKIGVCPIAVVGRANTSDQLDGFVKVITDFDEKIIGAAIVAPAAGELIHQFALAMKLKLRASVMADMIYSYPTFSEAIKIACSNLSVPDKG